MDGVLLIDKPAGPTSHDVVARIRRVSGERGVGHTGTLDPAATGLLPLVLGRATKLASFITGGDKTYEATIRLGVATSTDDIEGEPLPSPAGPRPSAVDVVAALEAFRGTFLQRPPNHSAKKISGEKAYALARQARPVDLAPVNVTVRALEVLDHGDDVVRIRVTAASGFYVRALARDLGERLGCGGHLQALRRTRSGAFMVEDAIGLAEAEVLGQGLWSRLLAPAMALPQFPAVTVNEVGLRRATHGNSLSPEHLLAWLAGAPGPEPVKVLGPDGRLVALAYARDGALHPVVVLG